MHGSIRRNLFQGIAARVAPPLAAMLQSRRPRVRSSRMLSIEPLDVRSMLHGDPVLVDINATGASLPSDFTQVGDFAYFVADNGANGRELWRTDGTAAGTFMVKDINSGSAASTPTSLTNVNGTLFFSADDGVHGKELWKSDGTSAGTVLVRDLAQGTGNATPSTPSNPQNLTNVNGVLYFAANNGDTGQELWKSDGTESGTVLVKDINPGSHTGYYGTLVNSSNPQNLVILNGTLFFTAEDQTNGRELWKSDGTESGTVMVKDISPGSYTYDYDGTTYTYPNSSSPAKLTPVGNALLFIATDEEDGAELWRSDGTDAGTFRLTSLKAGSASGFASTDALINVNGTLFFTADDTTHGRELWKSDGTIAGTVLVKDIQPGVSGSFVNSNLVNLNGVLLFAANGESGGEELWRSDGTEAGTVLVKDLDGTSISSSPRYFAAASDGVVYFSGFTGASGQELWLTDGTADDTRIVEDLVPGTGSSLPQSLFALGANLLFSAEVGNAGRELWLVEEEVVVTPPSTIELLAISDTGISNGDGLTNRNNATAQSALAFLVGGVTAGATIRIYADGLEIGSAVATGATAIVTTNGEGALADGAHNFTATAGQGSAESVPTTAITLTIDATAPAAITNSAPSQAQVSHAFTFDAASADEGAAGIVYSLSGAPTGMTISAATGLVEWTPAADQMTPQSFEIRITDSAGNTTSKPFALSVLGAISAANDSYTLAEDDVLSVDAATGVLANDGDDGSGALTVTIVNQPLHGAVTLNADGSFTYTPNGNYFGADRFTYQATNGDDVSNVAEVTLAVAGVHDAVVPVADSYSVNEDGSLNIDAGGGVLNNDGNVDGSTMTAALAAAPAHGTLTLNADGSFVYAPTANFFGTDAFSYTVNDGVEISSPVTVTINIAAVNDAPIAASDTYSMNEDGVLTVTAALGVLANDVDSDSTTLSAAISTQPTNGVLSLSADGSFVYTPNANFFGTDSFTYTVSDGGGTSTAVVTISVAAVGDAPTAADDAFTVASDGAAHTLDVRTNDTSSPDGTQALTIASVTQGNSGGVVTIVSGSVVYTPAADFVGVETFTYTLQDTDGRTDTATVSVTVSEAAENSVAGFVYIDANGNGARDAGEVGVPGVLVTLAGTTNGDEEISLTVITDNTGAYFFDALAAGTYQAAAEQSDALLDGIDTTSVSGVVAGEDQFTNIVLSGGVNAAGLNFGERGLKPTYVSLQLYLASTPPPAETLLETMALAEERTGNASLANTIRAGTMISPTNNKVAAPTASDSYTTAAGGSLSVTAAQGVLANDTVGGGASLTATVSTSPANGSLTLNANGGFVYTPNSGFTGTDTFAYTATAATAASATATATINVHTDTNAPVAVVDAYVVDSNDVLTVTMPDGLLENDGDADNDSLSTQLVTSPTHGTLSLNTDGSFTYTPAIDYVGTDQFTYRTSDGLLTSDAATVSLTILAVDTTSAAAASIAEANDPRTSLADMVDEALAAEDDWLEST